MMESCVVGGVRHSTSQGSHSRTAQVSIRKSGLRIEKGTTFLGRRRRLARRTRQLLLLLLLLVREIMRPLLTIHHHTVERRRSRRRTVSVHGLQVDHRSREGQRMEFFQVMHMLQSQEKLSKSVEHSRTTHQKVRGHARFVLLSNIGTLEEKRSISGRKPASPHSFHSGGTLPQWPLSRGSNPEIKLGHGDIGPQKEAPTAFRSPL